MKRGRTIVAEREQLETASERMQNRQKNHRKRVLSIIAAVLLIAILVISGVIAWKNLKKNQLDIEEKINKEPTAEIIDEAGIGITDRVKKYVVFLEEDFADLGYKVVRVFLPQGKSRELLVSLEGYDGYIKINIDRGSAVSAEDADRMIRYLKEQGSDFEYIDVKTEEKGYYK